MIDSITKKGTIIYRTGSSAVRDDGERLVVSSQADFETCHPLPSEMCLMKCIALSVCGPLDTASAWRPRCATSWKLP
ncbi:hypothetical protein [Verminephrobacter eiseniae]|uniref:hypothetical protein n=1 Tax=Verminephrobacter eiseniae TaxID=364317 RepID=UPI0038B2A7C5